MSQISESNLNPASLAKEYYYPKHWGTWISIALLRLCAFLPIRFQITMGRKIGTLVYHLAKSRRHITKTNIGLCFPELNQAEQQHLVKQTIQDNVIGFFESAYAWWNRPEKLVKNTQVIGLEHMHKLKENGQGVLVVGAHYSNLDLGGALVAQFIDLDVTYRPHDNAIFDHMIRSGRTRYFKRILDRSQIRDMVRRLKTGNAVWYAADQDYGRNHAVFAPFFGIDAATITGPSRLAKMSGCAVVIIRHQRKSDDSGYIIEFAPLEPFPNGDLVVDATAINHALEQQIRKFPSQYMWVHRRFKTRPEGESGFY